MKRKKIIALFSGLVAILLIAEVNGQVTNSLYFMPGVPQSNRINPAIQPNCNFYLGFPLLAPLRLELSSSSLAYKDFIYPDYELDSLITFLHPNADREIFLDALKPLNFVASDIGTSLASFGFRAGRNFISVDATTRVDGNFYYPGDVFKLLLNGAMEDETYSFDGLGVDLSVFNEVSIGWSRNILSNLDIGARAKFLFGVANVTTNRSDLRLTTSMDSWTIESDMLLSASLPFAEVTYDEEGLIEEVDVKDEFDNPSPNLISGYLFNTKNFGFAADLGVNFHPLDRLMLSASVTDLGFIRWTDGIHSASYELDAYEFKGIEVNPLSGTDDYSVGDMVDSTLTAIGDSLMGLFVMQEGGAYGKRLNTKLYLGASYFVTPKISFGLLSRTDFMNNKIAQQFTASANLTTGRFINLSLTYSYINNYFKNFGTGLSFNVGPFNMYLISDNILNLALWPEETQSVNLWFGLNLTFGYRAYTKRAKEYKDKPMVY
ncbi:MAG: hypothetical protein JXR52_06980 [Bacteroidales bacterium]|nr:hypothetical protein [Bacteroidales bacterium]MBN2698553.1 hypothetical protein [Bacteroidales bacterium]